MSEIFLTPLNNGVQHLACLAREGIFHLLRSSGLAWEGDKKRTFARRLRAQEHYLNRDLPGLDPVAGDDHHPRKWTRERAESTLASGLRVSKPMALPACGAFYFRCLHHQMPGHPCSSSPRSFQHPRNLAPQPTLLKAPAQQTGAAPAGARGDSGPAVTNTLFFPPREKCHALISQGAVDISDGL